MREAIASDESIPFYQPKVSLSTGEIVGLEALARWQHPTEGILTPSFFGAVFEDHEIAASIGKLLTSKIAADVRQWLDDHLPFGRIALNLSPAEFGQTGFVDNMLGTLDWLKIPPTFFEVEVTETVLSSCTVSRAWRPDRSRRFRHRLCLTDPFETVSSRSHQDRPQLRAESRAGFR
jgi:EAL domain-containing protein (putative c-di-GMP-specific phosphodiesterase class I)